MHPLAQVIAWRGFPLLLGLLVVLVVGCPFDPAAPARCVGDENCPAGYGCVDGFCVKDPALPTTDAADLDGAVVELDAAGRDVGGDASATDASAVADRFAHVDGALAEAAGPLDGAAEDRAAPDTTAAEGGADEAGPGDHPATDSATADASSADSGVLCDPSTCPASSEPCLLPTCGPNGCTFTVANDNTACPDGVCRSGQCEALCWIDGATVQPGALLAPGGCLACRPQVNPFEYRAVVDNDPCDDGLWCTGSDQCSGGLCAIFEYAGDNRCGGGTPRCDEVNDRCVQCTSSGHCSGGTPHCKLDTGTCVACLSPADCPDDGNVCTTTSCAANLCGHVDNTLGCTDNLWCTGTDTCSAGDCSVHQYLGNTRCSGGTPYCDEPNDRCVQCLSVANCPDDTNVCTTKVCTDGSCGQGNNTASCNDGLWCNGTDTCSGGGCITHQTTNVCSGVLYRPACNDVANRCECNATSCPAGWTCEATSKKCRRSQTFVLADNNQDGYQDPYTSATVLGVGEVYSYMSLYSNVHVGGLRFRLLNVSAGATIVSAYLTVYVNKTDATLDSPDLDIAAERVANATAMVGNVTNELTSKTLTTASVRWLASPLGVGWKNSPELKTVIQEVVQLPTWSGGNYVLLILRPRPDTNFEFLQREGGQPATLTVTHELP